MSPPERPIAPGDATGQPWLDAHVAEALFRHRRLMLHGPLDDERAARLAAELMTLEAEGQEPIMLSVNGPGGSLPALFTVIDTLHAMRAEVETRCAGQARGTAVALVAAGTGRRRSAPHAQFVLRLPEAEVSGRAMEIDTAAHAEGALCDLLFGLLVDVTARPRAQIVNDWTRGRVLSAEEASAEGLVDEVG